MRIAVPKRLRWANNSRSLFSESEIARYNERKLPHTSRTKREQERIERNQMMRWFCRRKPNGEDDPRETRSKSSTSTKWKFFSHGEQRGMGYFRQPLYTCFVSYSFSHVVVLMVVVLSICTSVQRLISSQTVLESFFFPLLQPSAIAFPQSVSGAAD